MSSVGDPFQKAEVDVKQAGRDAQDALDATKDAVNSLPDSRYKSLILTDLERAELWLKRHLGHV